MTDLHTTLCEMAARSRAILVKKNQDYAGGGDPFANFRVAAAFGVHPANGLLLRMTDKFKRIQSFVVNGRLAVAEEGLTDAIEDGYNYAILLLGMCMSDAAGKPITRPALIELHEAVTGDAADAITAGDARPFNATITNEFGNPYIYLVQQAANACVVMGLRALKSTPATAGLELRTAVIEFLIILAQLRHLAEQEAPPVKAVAVTEAPVVPPAPPGTVL